MAATRTLELTLISAKDLNNVNRASKMEVYAVVSLSGDPRGSRQQVKADRTGGRSPTWNATLCFAVPATGDGSLDVRLRAKRTLGDRDVVGEVRIPLSDLLSRATDGPVPVACQYQVRNKSSGEPQGVLNLSYKLGEVTQSAGANGSGYQQDGLLGSPFWSFMLGDMSSSHSSAYDGGCAGG